MHLLLYIGQRGAARWAATKATPTVTLMGHGQVQEQVGTPHRRTMAIAGTCDMLSKRRVVQVYLVRSHMEGQ